MWFPCSKSLLDLLKGKFNFSSFPGEEKWCQATLMRARCGNSLSGLLGSLGESRWRGGTRHIFQNWTLNGPLAKLGPISQLGESPDQSWMLTPSQLALDMSSSARQAQGPLHEALTQPGRGNAGTRSSAVPHSFTAGCELLYSSHDWGRRQRGEEKRGKWRERSGHPRRCRVQRKPGKARRESPQKKKTIQTNLGTKGKMRKGFRETSWPWRKRRRKGRVRRWEASCEEIQRSWTESELYKVQTQTPRSNLLLDLEKCPGINSSIWSPVHRNFL